MRSCDASISRADGLNLFEFFDALGVAFHQMAQPLEELTKRLCVAFGRRALPSLP
jgi:hypothetical protein